MLITFFQTDAGIIKATAKMFLTEETTGVVNLFISEPGKPLPEVLPKVSSYKKLHVYRVNDMIVKNDRVAILTNISPVKEDKVIEKNFYYAKKIRTKIFTIDTAIPIHVWVDKSKKEIVVATGYIDCEIEKEIDMTQINRLAIIKDQASLQEFIKILYTTVPGIAEQYQHLGYMKSFLIKGKENGLVNSLYKSFIKKEDKVYAHKEI